MGMSQQPPHVGSPPGPDCQAVLPARARGDADGRPGGAPTLGRSGLRSDRRDLGGDMQTPSNGLFGRDRELDEANEASETAASGVPQALLVGGDAGISCAARRPRGRPVRRRVAGGDRRVLPDRCRARVEAAAGPGRGTPRRRRTGRGPHLPPRAGGRRPIDGSGRRRVRGDTSRAPAPRPAER